MIQTCGLETLVTTTTSDVSSMDLETLVARLTESIAIDTDRRWGPTISMGNGHTTDAEVDDDGEDRIQQGNGVNDGGDAPHPLSQSATDDISIHSVQLERKLYKGVSRSPRTMLITRKSLVVHEFPATVCCGGVL
jgi:hypothetical protein